MEIDKRRPAPLLVCTYSFGESELPTVRPAGTLDQAAGIAREEAAAACRPLVRVYSFDPDCQLVMSVRT